MAFLPAATEILNVFAYAPMALFAESLRVQHAMASSILTRSSITPAMTGCIKDLHFLWDMNDTQLLGSFDERDTSHVASVRHGNTFRLQNQAVLILSQICGRKNCKKILPYTPGIVEGFPKRRETILNLSFVLPNAAPNGKTVRFSRLECICLLTSVFEVGFAIAIAVGMALHHKVVGVILMICFSLSEMMLGVLRYFTSLVIANQEAIAKDLLESSPRLDAHIIARHWNDSKLDVVCGYNKHIHALTNIPMVVDQMLLLRWTSRAIAFILIVQAASLASLVGAKGDAWISIAWTALYIFMLVPPQLLKRYASELPLEKHSAVVTRVPPIRFSGRRAALLFITLLPVSERIDVDRWAWMNVFMPDNDRRKRWREQVEDIAFEKSTCSKIGDNASTKDGDDDRIVRAAVQEAYTAYHHPQVLQSVLVFKSRLGIE